MKTEETERRRIATFKEMREYVNEFYGLLFKITGGAVFIQAVIDLIVKNLCK